MQLVDYFVVQSTNKEHKSTNKEKIYYMKCNLYAMSFYISEIPQIPSSLRNFTKTFSIRGFVKNTSYLTISDIKFKEISPLIA